MTENDNPSAAPHSSGNQGHDPSLLPQIPPQTALSLSLPMTSPNRASSMTGVSTQSMQTSSFAMSDDISEKLPPFDSLRIRKAYSRPPPSTMSVPDNDTLSEKHFSEDLEEPEIQNTDRYGFLRVQSSNCEPPEARNRAAVSDTNGTGLGKKKQSFTGRHKAGKLLIKKKEDILIEPPKADFETKMTAKEIERTKKWQDMAVVERHNGVIHYDFPITKKLLQRTFKGIPDCWRTTVWHAFLDSQAEARGDRESEADLIQCYYELLEQDCEDDAQIDLDVPRTISEHIFFRERYGTGQRLLFQVLHCISLKFPSHGYVQGMAAIAATLLCYYPDEIAFVMLVRLWQDKGLKQFFSREFDGLMSAFKTLAETLKTRPVGKKLMSLGIDPLSYATRWYLTLFNYSLPFHTQLRIWDTLMVSKNGPALLHATALALLNGLSGTSPQPYFSLSVVHPCILGAGRLIGDRLKNADFERAMKLVTARIDVRNDDRLMHLVFKEAVANGAIDM